MLLSRLTRGVALADQCGQDVEITSLTCDTRTLRPGGLFAAFRGAETDGNRFIRQALDQGAAAVLCEAPPPEPGPWLVSPEPRRAFGQLAANWFGRPGDRMTLIGVTGTNGKTTTTYLLKSVLEEVCRAKVGLIGTNQNLIGDQALPAQRTTPDAYALQELLARMEEAGCTHVVMEVSSHALALERTAGLWFRAGIFTNLTRDHLDFHGTMEAYRQAKGKLFSQCRAGIFNLDDGAGEFLSQTSLCRVVTFGRDRGQVRAGEITLGPDRVDFRVTTPRGSCPVGLSIPGDFTVSNALGVLACALELGLPLEETAAALGRAPGVKGRVEVVPVPAPYTVLIDYAHTPDALEKVLTALREFTPGRLICLFGCGGDRDRGKRPLMGAIAASMSDLAVVTSDNPRTEDPEAIIADILPGLEGSGTPYQVICDRVEAIHWAMDHAQPGDVIALCGKGHETYQEVNHEKHHMDEREIVAEHLTGK